MRADHDGLFREIRDAAVVQGWRIETTAKSHLKFLAPNGEDIVITSGSPGDFRAVNNFMSQMRRAGLDIKQEHHTRKETNMQHHNHTNGYAQNATMIGCPCDFRGFANEADRDRFVARCQQEGRANVKVPKQPGCTCYHATDTNRMSVEEYIEKIERGLRSRNISSKPANPDLEPEVVIKIAQPKIEKDERPRPSLPTTPTSLAVAPPTTSKPSLVPLVRKASTGTPPPCEGNRYASERLAAMCGDGRKPYHCAKCTKWHLTAVAPTPVSTEINELMVSGSITISERRDGAALVGLVLASSKGGELELPLEELRSLVAVAGYVLESDVENDNDTDDKGVKRTQKSGKTMQSVLDDIRAHPRSSPKDVAARLGFADSATASSYLSSLYQQGRVSRELGEGTGNPGRPAFLYIAKL